MIHVEPGVLEVGRQAHAHLSAGAQQCDFGHVVSPQVVARPARTDPKKSAFPICPPFQPDLDPIHFRIRRENAAERGSWRDPHSRLSAKRAHGEAGGVAARDRGARHSTFANEVPEMSPRPPLMRALISTGSHPEAANFARNQATALSLRPRAVTTSGDRPVER
jgi:hypothetical protein